jgi:hypothetical protein
MQVPVKFSNFIFHKFLFIFIELKNNQINFLCLINNIFILSKFLNKNILNFLNIYLKICFYLVILIKNGLFFFKKN